VCLCRRKDGDAATGKFGTGDACSGGRRRCLGATFFSHLRAGEGAGEGSITLLSMKTGSEDDSRKKPIRTLFASGHLVYLQKGTILAVPFDLHKEELTGAPVPVLQGVRISSRTLRSFQSRETDTAYISARLWACKNTLVSVDRTGRETPAPRSRREAMKTFRFLPTGNLWR